MPDRFHLSKEENSMPGHKTIENGCSMIGGNIIERCELTTLILYRTENPRLLKNFKTPCLSFGNLGLYRLRCLRTQSAGYR